MLRSSLLTSYLTTVYGFCREVHEGCLSQDKNDSYKAADVSLD